MNKEIPKFANGQPDFFTTQGDPDSVSEEEEASARSTKEERMITKREARKRYAIVRAEIDRTKKCLQKKPKKQKMKKKADFPN